MKQKIFRSLALSGLAIIVLPSQALATVVVSSVGGGGAIDLTATGSLDWMKLGDGSNTGAVYQKAGVNHIGPVIGAPVGFVSNDFGSSYPATWNDGDGAGTTGTSVGGNLEAKSPVGNDGAFPSLSFDITGLVAGSYQLQVFTTRFRSNTSFTASLNGGTSDAITSTAPTGDTVFTVNFSATAGQDLSVVWEQTGDRGGGVDDNVGIAAITLVAVPEPSYVALLSLGLLVLLNRRRQ